MVPRLESTDSVIVEHWFTCSTCSHLHVGSSWTRDQNHVSYHWQACSLPLSHQESPRIIALWHVLIYAVSSLVLFAEADWRLMLPLVAWIIAYVIAIAWFVPRVKQRSVESSDARSRP